MNLYFRNFVASQICAYVYGRFVGDALIYYLLLLLSNIPWIFNVYMYNVYIERWNEYENEAAAAAVRSELI